MSLLILPVMADDSIQPSPNITFILTRNQCEGPQCAGGNYSYGIWGDSYSLNATMAGLYVVRGRIDPDSNDNYTFDIHFIDGSSITGTIEQTSIYGFLGKQTNVQVNGKNFNTSSWGITPQIHFDFGINSITGTNYLLVSKFSYSPRLEIPLTGNIAQNPIVYFKVDKSNSETFYYEFAFESAEYLNEDIYRSLPTGEDPITMLLGIIGIVWVALLFLLGPDGVFDWLFIHAGLVWIVLLVEMGMMAYYSNSSKDVFVFYQKMIKGNKSLFEFLIALAQGTLTAIKMAVDLVNPLRWIFG